MSERLSNRFLIIVLVMLSEQTVTRPPVDVMLEV